MHLSPSISEALNSILRPSNENALFLELTENVSGESLLHWDIVLNVRLLHLDRYQTAFIFQSIHPKFLLKIRFLRLWAQNCAMPLTGFSYKDIFLETKITVVQWNFFFVEFGKG